MLTVGFRADSGVRDSSGRLVRRDRENCREPPGVGVVRAMGGNGEDEPKGVGDVGEVGDPTLARDRGRRGGERVKGTRGGRTVLNSNSGDCCWRCTSTYVAGGERGINGVDTGPVEMAYSTAAWSANSAICPSS